MSTSLQRVDPVAGPPLACDSAATDIRRSYLYPPISIGLAMYRCTTKLQSNCSSSRLRMRKMFFPWLLDDGLQIQTMSPSLDGARANSTSNSFNSRGRMKV